MRSASSVFAISFLALCLASRPIHAATATTSFSVSATVQVSCSVSSTARAFGTYNAVTENLRSFDLVHCSNPTPYNIFFSAGRATISTEAAKVAPSVSASSGYDFLPSAMSSLDWHQLLSKHRASGIGVGSNREPLINGETMEIRYVAPGSYVDTVIVSVIY
jgi:spore coat protein U-like protein